MACFRSTGSVSVPTRRASTAAVVVLPPPPRKSSVPEPLQLSQASVSVLEPLGEEIAESLSTSRANSFKANFVVIEPSEKGQKAIEIDPPKVTSVARPKAKPKNNCVSKFPNPKKFYSSLENFHSFSNFKGGFIVARVNVNL